MNPEAAPFDLRLLDAVLERAGDLTEIKAVLAIVRLSAGGSPRVPLSRLLAPDWVRVIAGQGSPEPGEVRVRRALERAVADGLLHRVTVRDGSGEEVFVLLATAGSVALLEDLRAGVAGADIALELPPGEEIEVHRPNVFSVYEREIGPLSPLVAEHLRAAERAYPRDWLDLAIRQAADYNARNWRYIETILRRWEAEGGPSMAIR